MLSLSGKHIVLGVTGSIAAYKSADLVRRLRDAGAELRVVMTKIACEFITPLTLETLSHYPVAIDLLDTGKEFEILHISLARWADWMLIAPASADIISRLAQGRADDLLSALILASECPLALVPAMNNKMWSNQATVANLELLRSRGVQVLGPAGGEQACGERGSGCLLDPLSIVSDMEQLVVPGALQDKQVLVTAGPTFEPIDPVRFIGNKSSGKMGFAIAQAAAEAGATVVLIAGPVNLVTPPGVIRINVETAKEMFDSVFGKVAESDIFIGCAAVSDYRPSRAVDHKIKKTKHNLRIELEPTIDIISEITKKDNEMFVVGFAAETHNVTLYAKEKLRYKRLDMIAANKVGKGVGLSVDCNMLDVFWHNGHHTLKLASKVQLARNLMKLIIKRYYVKNKTETS